MTSLTQLVLLNWRNVLQQDMRYHLPRGNRDDGSPPGPQLESNPRRPFQIEPEFGRRQEVAETLPRVLNLAEAAKFVRCSRAHLCNVVNGKVPDIPRLPAVRVGRRVLFRRESLERWLREVEAATSGGPA